MQEYFSNLAYLSLARFLCTVSGTADPHESSYIALLHGVVPHEGIDFTLRMISPTTSLSRRSARDCKRNAAVTYSLLLDSICRNIDNPLTIATCCRSALTWLTSDLLPRALRSLMLTDDSRQLLDEITLLFEVPPPSLAVEC
jgi:hypothetical protein